MLFTGLSPINTVTVTSSLVYQKSLFGSYSLSPSCRTRKKTAKKMTAENPGAEQRTKGFSFPGFRAAIISSTFIYGHGLSREEGLLVVY